MDVVSATASYWSGIIGPVGTMGWCIPYSYSNPREMDTFLKGPYTEMMRDVHGKFNIHYLGQQLVSSYPIISSKPIRTVDDLAKLKIRCVGLTAHTVV